MNKKIFSSTLRNSVSLEFLHFSERDFITIKAQTDREAGEMFGRQTAGVTTRALKDKLSAAKNTNQIEESKKLLNAAKALIKKQAFVIDGIDYLSRYMETLTGFCEGAGISMLHGVFLQSFADIGCQTLLAWDEKKQAINVAHTEENPDDPDLIKLHKILEPHRHIVPYDELFSRYGKLINSLYAYKVVRRDTKNSSQIFFAYPGLCSAGPAFGINLTHNTLFVADYLTPKQNGSCDLWANAIISMFFDCGDIGIIQKLAEIAIKSNIQILGGYAFHAVQWIPKLSMVSYEFGSRILQKQPYEKKGARKILGQTNFPRGRSFQAIDVYEKHANTEDDFQISHLLKRRTEQLRTIAATSVYPSTHPETDVKNLLDLLASPFGDIETFDHGPAFEGFPTLNETAYVAGSFSAVGGKIVIGKLAPPPIKGQEYSLLFDPANPTHRAHKLEDLKTLAAESKRSMKKPLRVTVIYNMPSRRILETPYGATDEDTSYVARKVQEALRKKHMQASLLAINEDAIEDIGTIQADCIFNLIDWTGLDIHLSQKAFGYLRALGIPVTGATEHNYMETANKLTMKEALQKARIPTPDFQIFTTGREIPRENLPYPVIVKPAFEHCSIGLHYDVIAQTQEQLQTIALRQIREFHQPALAEEFISGRELLVYILEEEKGIRILPIEEIQFTNHRKLAFQTYESKWDQTHEDYKTARVVMAELSKDERGTIEKICVQAFQKLGFRGYARFDIRLKEGTPYVLETNCNPNVYDSDEDQIPGIPFADFIYTIVQSALRHDKNGWKI
jgi:D-alanine-D-alanine ligase